jgi:hypothetical protein
VPFGVTPKPIYKFRLTPGRFPSFRKKSLVFQIKRKTPYKRPPFVETSPDVCAVNYSSTVPMAERSPFPHKGRGTVLQSKMVDEVFNKRE